MKKSVRFQKYLAVFRVGSVNRKAYIVDFISGLLYLPIRFVILLLVWQAIFAALGVKEMNGYSYDALMRYYLTTLAIASIPGYFNTMAYRVWSEINSGEFSKFLCRPISYLWYHLWYGIGYIRYALFVCMPVFIGVWLLSGHNGVMLLLFLLSVIGSMLITFCLQTLIGLATFRFDSIFGLRDLVLHVGQIFSGALIPVAFLPGAILEIGRYLPFRFIYDVPVSILLSGMSVGQAGIALAQQFAYVVILGILAHAVLGSGLKRYEASGG